MPTKLRPPVPSGFPMPAAGEMNPKSFLTLTFFPVVGVPIPLYGGYPLIPGVCKYFTVFKQRLMLAIM
ncbi:hypothetical protein QBC43DRAFT_291096 [Cladorrhinum sp. PSN259]|nr:hypothetical protein QBC43DRAFT_291096 [Cladorrhinum sp. PSN259]